MKRRVQMSKLICPRCKKNLSKAAIILDDKDLAIFWHKYAHLKEDYIKTMDAYQELWAAVENGTLEKDFFELRAKFRRTISNNS